MKKNILAFVIGLIVAAPIWAATTAPKIAVFDAQEVLDSIDEGKAAVAKLEKAVLSKKKKIDTEQKTLEKMKKDLDGQALVMSKTAMAEKEKEFQKKFIAFEQMRMNAQRSMQQEELSATGEIFKKINAVIQKIGKDKNYDFILEKNQGAVTYFKKEYEITSTVIQMYNKTYPSSSKPKK